MTKPAIPTIFSRQRRASVFARAGGEDFVQRDMEDDLLDRIGFMRMEPDAALVVSADPARLVDALTAQGTRASGSTPLELDEEQPYPVTDQDLVLSLGTLDTVNDLPGALIHLRHALRPGGVAMASFIGAGSLATLREILIEADGERPAARIHPMVDNRAAAELMQRAGFTRQVVDNRTVTVSYRTFEGLVRDLRKQGLTNRLASPPPPLSREAMVRAQKAFDGRRDAEGLVIERFEILTLTGWQ